MKINSSVGKLLKNKKIPKKKLVVTNVTTKVGSELTDNLSLETVLPYTTIKYSEDKKVNDYLNLKNRDIQKVHTTARLVLGKIFQEVNDKLSGSNQYNGLYIKWLESNGFNRMTALRHRNRYNLYQIVTTDKAKGIIATLKQSDIDFITKSPNKDEVIKKLNTDGSLEITMDKIEEANIIPLEIDLESEYEKISELTNKVDLKKLSTSKAKRLYKLFNEIEKIINIG